MDRMFQQHVVRKTFSLDILDEQLGCVLNHPRVAGVFVWQYCDVRVDEVMWGGRPRCMNNKGAVDEHRRPKQVFDVIKRRFAAKAGAHGTVYSKQAQERQTKGNE